MMMLCWLGLRSDVKSLV